MSATVNDFDRPKEVDSLSAVFGGEMAVLLPPMAIIPPEFKRWDGTKWNKFVSKWFFEGASMSELTPRNGIDPKDAIRHAKAIMASWEPKHEHKEAAVAWLLSLWFSEVSS